MTANIFLILFNLNFFFFGAKLLSNLLVIYISINYIIDLLPIIYNDYYEYSMYNVVVLFISSFFYPKKITVTKKY